MMNWLKLWRAMKKRRKKVIQSQRMRVTVKKMSSQPRKQPKEPRTELIVQDIPNGELFYGHLIFSHIIAIVLKS